MSGPAATRATLSAERCPSARSALLAVLRTIVHRLRRLPTLAQRRLLAVLLPLAVLVLAPGTASAHAQVVALDPPDGTIVATSPTAFTVTFDEPVGLASGGLEVIDASGRVVDAGLDVVEGAVMRQPLGPLPDGWYVATWGVVSEDGHIVRASSVFGVGDADAAARPADETGDGGWAAAIARFATDLGMLVGVGAWAAWWLLGARIQGVRRLALGALAVALAGTIVWAALEAADGGSAWLATPAAMLALVRGISLALALLAGWRWLAASAAIAALSLVTLAGGGHAAGDLVATVLLSAHLAAAIVWLGAAPAVLLALRSTGLSDGEATAVVRRFSRLAGLALVAIAVAGAALTWNLSDGLAGGLGSAWAVTLGGKLALVGGAALLGFAGRRHLAGVPDRRRLLRLFLVDAAVLIVVAVLSSALTLTSPHVGHAGHEAGGDARCVAAVGERSVSVIATPGRVGSNEVLVGGVPENVVSVTLRWAHELTAGGALTMDAAWDGTAWTGTGALPLSGAWDVTIDVRIDTFTQESGTCTLTIAA